MKQASQPSSAPASRRSQFYYWTTSHNWCGFADPLVAAIKTPLGALVAAFIVVLILGIAVGTSMLWAAGTIFFIGAVGTLWPALTIGGLRGELEFERRRINEKEPVQTKLILENRWPWPTWGIMCRRDLSEPEPAACGGLPAASKTTFTSLFTPQVRGVYPKQECLISTGFPFGIYNRSRPTKIRNTLIVWPRTVPLKSLLDSAETRPSEDRFTDARCGESGDVLGTRPFRNGDSLRRIHWPQTARTGSLVVCERQASATSAIRIVVDTDPTIHEMMNGESSLEWALRIVASIAMAYQSKQAAVEVCFLGQCIKLGQGTSGVVRFLDQLAHIGSAESRTQSKGIPSREEQIAPREKNRADSGVFQVRVTTRQGLNRGPEHRSLQGDQLCIVLSNEEANEATFIRHTKFGRTIWIRQSEDPLLAFQDSWEKLCHVG